MSKRILVLADGRHVTLGQPTAGGSKNETIYGVLSDGQPVVVKIETRHGRLAIERTALRFARLHDVPVPSLVADGRTPDGRPFLVLSREDGVRASAPAGWFRLGRDLARLAGVPIDRCPLPRVSCSEFIHDHRSRLDVVEHIFDHGVARRIAASIERLGRVQTLVFTHGDPGSGNYLDGEQAGVILDWEDATVAPFGIDVGRAAFIALMDNGHTGVPEDLHDAVVRGYRAGLRDRGSAPDDVLHAATLVAGLQFVHGRFTRPLRPDRTAHGAAAVVESYLGVI